MCQGLREERKCCQKFILNMRQKKKNDWNEKSMRLHLAKCLFYGYFFFFSSTIFYNLFFIMFIYFYKQCLFVFFFVGKNLSVIYFSSHWVHSPLHPYFFVFYYQTSPSYLNLGFFNWVFNCYIFKDYDERISCKWPSPFQKNPMKDGEEKFLLFFVLGGGQTNKSKKPFFSRLFNLN